MVTILNIKHSLYFIQVLFNFSFYFIGIFYGPNHLYFKYFVRITFYLKEKLKSRMSLSCRSMQNFLSNFIIIVYGETFSISSMLMSQ